MKNFKSLFTSVWPHAVAILCFFIIVFIYFYPAFEGKELPQGDVVKYEGMAKELSEYGKPSGWLGSMFSGMPSYQVSGYSEGINFIDWIKTGLINLMQGWSSGPIFVMLICSYILFLVLGANIFLAFFGAICVTFSSYNFIIIDAGHVTKLWTLAYAPLIFAGMYVVAQKKYLPGFLLFTFGLTLQVTMNHFQITYYTAIFCAILFVYMVVSSVEKKTYKHLALCCGIFLVALLFTIGTNITNLYETEELSKESTRGKTELTPLENNSVHASNGLDKDYVFAWSYGKAETLSLLIPNVMGGISQPLNEKSESYKVLVQKAQSGQIDGSAASQLFNYGREYWGDQPFTSGPVYFGAIVCLLFVFSFFVVKSDIKWWLLGAAVFFIILSWGKNLAWFNDFMYYHFPMYSKFRAVSMTLVIPAFIFPILAVMALKDLFSGKADKQQLKKALIWSTGVVGGICLILWIVPGVFFNFHTDAELQGMPMWYLDALEKDRKGLLQADALRSLIFILLAAGTIFWYLKSENKKNALKIASIFLIILVLCDMWQIDKRYLNNGKFITAHKYKEQIHRKMPVNEAILQDKSPSYRVLNLNNPFNETYTSYYHKSIGGYHAAKLRRYQDLIERRLTGEIQQIINTLGAGATENSIRETMEKCPSLNMLNTKYIIYDPSKAPIYNPAHDGNAWFVNSYRFVGSADEEIAALDLLDPRTEAVLDNKFASNMGDLKIIPDSIAKIEMISYAPNKMMYQSSSQQKGLAIFSEIYYPHGWKAFIDGKRVPINRADWTLRALVVPAGQHQIEMVFDHDGVKICGLITSVSSGILLLLFIGSLVWFLFFNREKQSVDNIENRKNDR